MKHKLMLIVSALTLALCGVVAFGQYTGARIDASSTNIPTTFTEGNASSEAVQCAKGEFSIKTAAGDIYHAIGNASTAPGATGNAPIDDGDSFSGEIVAHKATIYIRSATGSALSTGIVYITCQKI